MGNFRNFFEHKGNQDTLKWGAGAFLVLFSMYLLQRYVLGDMIGSLILGNAKYYCFIIWVSFALTTAKLEAYYYAHEMNSHFVDNFNEHTLFNFIRLCVWVPLWIIAGWKIALCLGAMFPFLHDGMYYVWRNRIQPGLYPKKWFDQSTTSTALSTKYMTPAVRSGIFLLAIISLIFLA